MPRMMKENEEIWRIKVTYDETRTWASPPTKTRHTTYLGPYRSKAVAKGQLSHFTKNTYRDVIAVQIQSTYRWTVDEEW